VIHKDEGTGRQSSFGLYLFCADAAVVRADMFGVRRPTRGFLPFTPALVIVCLRADLAAGSFGENRTAIGRHRACPGRFNHRAHQNTALRRLRRRRSRDRLGCSSRWGRWIARTGFRARLGAAQLLGANARTHTRHRGEKRAHGVAK